MEMIDRYSSPASLALCSNSPVAVCRLVFEVADHDHESIALLRGERGNAILWEQRHAVSWVAREYVRASFTQIGRALNCDHSVIVRGYNRAKLLRRLDPDFVSMCNQLVASLPRRKVVQRHVLRAMPA